MGDQPIVRSALAFHVPFGLDTKNLLLLGKQNPWKRMRAPSSLICPQVELLKLSYIYTLSIQIEASSQILKLNRPKKLNYLGQANFIKKCSSGDKEKLYKGKIII